VQYPVEAVAAVVENAVSNHSQRAFEVLQPAGSHEIDQPQWLKAVMAVSLSS
jgi:hypothetical protein